MTPDPSSLLGAPARVGVLLGLIGLASCRRDPAPEPAPVASIELEAGDPNALLEGPLVVLGLELPAGSRLRGEGSSAASAVVAHPFERVVDYLERHLTDARKESRTDGAVITGSTTSSGANRLRVVVARTGAGVSLLMSLEPAPSMNVRSTPPETSPERPVSALRAP